LVTSSTLEPERSAQILVLEPSDSQP
jgi:hypothetical protein